jgi:hypothetical protein
LAALPAGGGWSHPGTSPGTMVLRLWLPGRNHTATRGGGGLSMLLGYSNL